MRVWGFVGETWIGREKAKFKGEELPGCLLYENLKSPQARSLAFYVSSCDVMRGGLSDVARD